MVMAVVVMVVMVVVCGSIWEGPFFAVLVEHTQEGERERETETETEGGRESRRDDGMSEEGAREEGTERGRGRDCNREPAVPSTQHPAPSTQSANRDGTAGGQEEGWNGPGPGLGRK